MSRIEAEASAPESEVPRATELSQLYGDEVEFQRERWRNLIVKFKDVYGSEPEFVSRSPGRVNIIGEHIDYSLFPVLPMAITRDALIAVSTAQSEDADSFKITISNVLSEKFPAREFSCPNGSVTVDSSKHDWTNYFKSGLKGALEMLRESKGSDFKPRSLKIVMDGSVPSGAGLSSSAAFVTASALAVLVANGEKHVDKKLLTEVAIVSEREVGVNSGGMDQSASVMSAKGAATLVSFEPSLSARPVSFPDLKPRIAFLVTESFVRADKAVSAKTHYNLRVVECTLAALVLNKLVNDGAELPKDKSPLGVSLYGFLKNFVKKRGLETTVLQDVQQLSVELRLALDEVNKAFVERAYWTIQEVAELLGTTVEKLQADYTSKFPIEADKFKLARRARHVIQEALRVQEFTIWLENSEASNSLTAAAFSEKLGQWMNDSQASCRDLYDCSAPELDRICEIARRHGSYGSRLTGAGWGGCAVHLVPENKVGDVRDALRREYYDVSPSEDGPPRELTQQEKDNAVVFSKPGPGSRVVYPEEIAAEISL
ncbi:hypothetical protein OQA88_12976 [Cercophora sp. LCS_1]